MNEPRHGKIEYPALLAQKLYSAHDIAKTRRVQADGSWASEGLQEIQRLIKPIFLKVKLGMMK